MADAAPPAAAPSDEKKKKEKKAPRGAPPEGFQQKKQLTKAERRELQEKQRAAKAASQAEKGGAKKGGQQGGGKRDDAGKKKGEKRDDAPKDAKRRGVLGHLAPVRWDGAAASPAPDAPGVHPAVVGLGARYASGQHDDANERCVEMLAAFKMFVSDYELSPQATVNRDLDKQLRPQIQHLIDCRPHSASMGAAIKKLRQTIAALPPETSAADAKAELREAIDAYVQERIVLPGKVISKLGADKIRDGDVVVTFGTSDAVEAILKAAKVDGTDFRVVVLDAAPDHSGRDLLRSLHGAGVDTTYALLHAAPLLLKSAAKVFLGADALFSNGAVLARAGTAAVSLLAHAQNVPVLVCCESYKFHDRVQLDSVANNELVDLDPPPRRKATADDPPPEEAAAGGDDDDDDAPKPVTRQIKYDVTPAKYVSAIISEHGLLPPSACAVLIRELGETEGKDP